MAQVDTNCTMDDEELSAFLSEIDADWANLEPTPLVASISPRENKLISSKKPRRYPRVDILNTRQEVADLQNQLQHLREKHEFHELLQATRSSCRLNWERFASRERIQLRSAIQANDQLRKDVDANSRLIQRTVKSTHRQMKTIPKSVQMDSRIVSPKNEAHVRRVMQACLEHRSKDQLDAIVNECNAVAFDSVAEQEMAEWDIFSREDRGVSVEFHECIVLPFSSSFINGEIGRWPSLSALQIFKTEGKLTRSNQDRMKAAPLDRRLILRRLVNAGDRTIMLWEDAFCLKDSNMSPPVLVRGSGWTLIASVAGHEDELSVVHSGGLIQILASEGSKLHHADTVTRDIVAYTQLMQRSRITSLEDVLIDALHAKSSQVDKFRLF